MIIFTSGKKIMHEIDQFYTVNLRITNNIRLDWTFIIFIIKKEMLGFCKNLVRQLTLEIVL